jgi:hypothetical protein
MAKEVDLSNAKERDKFWNDRAIKILKGKTIVQVRYLTADECENNMWYKRGLVMILNDGTKVIPGSDDEFNDTGVLHYVKNDEWDCLPSL